MGIEGIEGVAMLGNRAEISRGGGVDKNVVVVDLGSVRVGDQLHGVL